MVSLFLQLVAVTCMRSVLAVKFSQTDILSVFTVSLSLVLYDFLSPRSQVGSSFVPIGFTVI